MVKKEKSLFEQLTEEEQSCLEGVLIGISESTEGEFDEAEIETEADRLKREHRTALKAEKALEKELRAQLLLAAEALRPFARPTGRILAIIDQLNAEDDSDDDEDNED